MARGRTTQEANTRKEIKGQNEAGKWEKQAINRHGALAESQQLPAKQSARAATLEARSHWDLRPWLQLLSCQSGWTGLCPGVGRGERQRKDDSHLVLMSRVSWQKEAGRSESINFQVGCWSMTAGEAAASSSSREGSTLCRPSWHRTSGALENPRNTWEMRDIDGRLAGVTKEMDLNEVRISEALSL